MYDIPDSLGIGNFSSLVLVDRQSGRRQILAQCWQKRRQTVWKFTDISLVLVDRQTDNLDIGRFQPSAGRQVDRVWTLVDFNSLLLAERQTDSLETDRFQQSSAGRIIHVFLTVLSHTFYITIMYDDKLQLKIGEGQMQYVPVNLHLDTSLQ